MSSSTELAAYIAEQLSDAGSITYKKMFGEYGFYCNGIFFSLLCDDQFFVKVTEAGKNFLKDFELEPPYTNAKPCFLITDLDDRDFLKELTQITCQELSSKAKPKAKKTQKN